MAGWHRNPARRTIRIRKVPLNGLLGRSRCGYRTFNNYFASKEQAIAWLAGRHATGMASALRGRPAGEPLAEALAEALVEALVEVVAGLYRPATTGDRRTGCGTSARSWRASPLCTAST